MAHAAAVIPRGVGRAHRRPGPLWAFAVGGLWTVAAIVLLHRSYEHRSQLVALGFVIVVAGCIDAVTSARHMASAAAEEVAVLRLTLEVERGDREAAETRISDLERELSTHSRALARLLDR